MKRASPVQLRQALEVANTLVKHGINFVCVPVIDEAAREGVLALIAENERLAADCSSMRSSLKAYAATTKKLVKDGSKAARERDQLRAEIAGLKTGYQAYEQVNAELKAEVDGLRKDAERYRFLRNGLDGLDLSCADTMEEIDALIDAAIGKGEQ